MNWRLSHRQPRASQRFDLEDPSVLGHPNMTSAQASVSVVVESMRSRGGCRGFSDHINDIHASMLRREHLLVFVGGEFDTYLAARQPLHLDFEADITARYGQVPAGVVPLDRLHDPAAAGGRLVITDG